MRRYARRMTIAIAVDDPESPDVIDLIAEHLAEMHAVSPAESVHALGPGELAGPAITVWSARAADGTLLTCRLTGGGDVPGGLFWQF